PFVEWEVDDPAQLETVAVDEIQFLAGAGAGFPGKLVELRRIAGNEEAGVAFFQTELRADRLSALLADVLGERAGAFEHGAFLAPEDITEARLAGRLGPGVHTVAEGARTTGL